MAAPKILVTPTGVTVYPKLNTPDTKYVAEGVYETKMRFTNEDAAGVIENIQAEWDKGIAAAKVKAKGKKIKLADEPWEVEEDTDGNPTGFTVIKFKMVASGTRKDGSTWKRSCPLWTSKGKAVKTIIGGGSKVRIGYYLTPYEMNGKQGIAIKLSSVQIVELSEYGGSNPFEDVDDGYDPEDTAGSEFDTDDTDDDADDDAGTDDDVDF